MKRRIEKKREENNRREYKSRKEKKRNEKHNIDEEDQIRIVMNRNVKATQCKEMKR